MANTSAVYARIDSELKESAEGILLQLGISPSNAIQMLYSQVVLTGSFPFRPALPRRVPKALSEMSRAQIDEELEKAVSSAQKGAVYSNEDVDKILAEEFGI